MALLEELVPANVVDSYLNPRTKRMTTAYINWQAVSAQLDRTPEECQERWRGLQSTKLKMGPFTPEEDALIAERVAKYAERRRGLWPSLQKDLGRSARNILARWRYISRFKERDAWSWTDDMVRGSAFITCLVLNLYLFVNARSTLLYSWYKILLC